MQTANQGESDQIRARAAEMLQWMATAEAQNGQFGEGVVERACELAGEALIQIRAREQERLQDQTGEGDQIQEQTQSGALNQNQNGAGSKGGK